MTALKRFEYALGRAASRVECMAGRLSEPLGEEFLRGTHEVSDVR